jgi:molybdopterin molybdotransferase
MGYKDMLGRGEVVSVDEARRIFYSAYVPPEPETEEAPLSEALGRVLASDIVSGTPLPEFPRSSMDGYAAYSADTFGASESLPAYLKLAGEIRMGEPASVPLSRGQVFTIPTGGMLPVGADAVVMLEHTQALGTDEVEVLKPVAPGENVVQPGDDIRAGETVLSKGRRLRPQDLGALAGIGVTKPLVFKMPKVAIINTGNEVIAAEQKPLPGQVRDVNSYNLAGLVRQAGGIPVLKGIFRDDYGLIRGALEDGLSDCDIVALTGGSSVGTGDLTAKVINDAGKPGVLVHGVSVRPGKPVIIGVVKGKPVFGLPGHPVAVTVSFELFLGPLIKKASGETDPLGIAGIPNVRVVEAKMARNYSSAPGREDHLRVLLKSEGGELFAHPVLGKSGLISTLVKAHGTVVIPVEKPGLLKGEKVTVRLFE